MTLAQIEPSFYKLFENIESDQKKMGDALGVYSDDVFYNFHLLRLCRREVRKYNIPKKEIKKHEHTHNVFHILMVMEGVGRITHKGKFLEIKKNDVVCINPGESHNLRCMAHETLRIIILTFELKTKSKREYENNLSHYLQHLFACEVKTMEDSIYHVDVIKFKTLVEKCEEILNGVVGNSFKRISSHYQSTLLKYFSDLNEVIQGVASSQNKRSPEYIQGSLRYIEEHYQNDISIQDLADKAELSKAYFQRSFKKYTGATAIELLKFYRINAAKQLLIHTEYKLATIASQCGFKNEYYFSKVFKDSAGLSPGVFRNKNVVD